jgi:hypothetical protein
VGIEQLDQFGKVGKRPRQPVYLVHDDDVDLAGTDIGKQPLEVKSTPQRLSAASCADPRPAITKARSSQNWAILLSCAAISDLLGEMIAVANEASHAIPIRRHRVSYSCRHRRHLPGRDRYFHRCRDDLKRGGEKLVQHFSNLTQCTPPRRGSLGLYGVSHDAVYRHFKNHFTEEQRAAYVADVPMQER